MRYLILLLALPLCGQEPVLRSWQVPQQYQLPSESSKGSRDAISASPLQLLARQHRRLLVMKPGKFLLAIDWLNDTSGAVHDFAQRFHLAPEWIAEAGPRG